MKLQKQLSKKIGGKVYYKYVIVLPSDVVEKAGFKEGEELEARAAKGKIVVSQT